MSTRSHSICEPMTINPDTSVAVQEILLLVVDQSSSRTTADMFVQLRQYLVLLFARLSSKRLGEHR